MQARMGGVVLVGLACALVTPAAAGPVQLTVKDVGSGESWGGKLPAISSDGKTVVLPNVDVGDGAYVMSTYSVKFVKTGSRNGKAEQLAFVDSGDDSMKLEPQAAKELPKLNRRLAKGGFTAMGFHKPNAAMAGLRLRASIKGTRVKLRFYLGVKANGTTVVRGKGTPSVLGWALARGKRPYAYVMINWHRSAAAEYDDQTWYPVRLKRAPAAVKPAPVAKGPPAPPPAEKPPASKSPAPPPQPIPVKLKRTHIMQGMRSARRHAATCAQYGKGMVKIAIKVGSNGQVISAMVRSAPNKDVGDCIADAVRKATFPRSQLGAMFTYPFLLR